MLFLDRLQQDGDAIDAHDPPAYDEGYPVTQSFSLFDIMAMAAAMVVL